MSNREQTTDKYGIVIERRVSVAATLRLIRPGEVRRFERKRLGSEVTLRAAISRANLAAGRTEYTIELEQHGDVYVVSRAPAAG